MARRVAISIDPLAGTRTKNEESPRARASPRSDYFGFCSDARRRYAVQKNGTGPFLARPIGESRFSSSIDEDEGGQFVSPHGARPQKPETAARHG